MQDLDSYIWPRSSLQHHRAVRKAKGRNVEKQHVGGDTTAKPTREDGPLLLPYEPTMRDRLLEFALPGLWLLVAVVVAAVFWS